MVINISFAKLQFCHQKSSSKAGGGAEVIINEAKKERRYYLKGIKNNLFN